MVAEACASSADEVASNAARLFGELLWLVTLVLTVAVDPTAGVLSWGCAGRE